ncbi:hypothetical protein PP2015_975 [Pseudoalteromonas phenolica]|uniref:Uncharacterized protein n=1 Tax=Pseudoalteromonas phenolica TaxID=161398 RepID=A0A0S2K0A4_9GAMM|nr:hypothetical protein PP2015_975 [Pseudoalteromonas phenolica]
MLTALKIYYLEQLNGKIFALLTIVFFASKK